MLLSQRIVRVLTVGIAASSCFVVIGACSDPPNHPRPADEGRAQPANPVGGRTAEGGAGDASTKDGGDGGKVCNDLVLTGSLIDRTGIPGDPPVATGGTIIDGSYELTTWSVYVGASGVAGPTGITGKANLRIAGSRLDDLYEIGGTGKTTTVTQSSADFTVVAASFSTASICPAGPGKSRQFTATDVSIVIVDLGTKEEFTFAKR